MKIQLQSKKHPGINRDQRKYFAASDISVLRFSSGHSVLFAIVIGVMLTFLSVTITFGNGLTIANVSPDQGTGTITFDLSWDNSWRNSASIAANWDAAWVFVKWRDCSAGAVVQFTHGLVSTTLSDHNFNVLSGATTFEPTRADGTVGIDASPDNTGVMLRNSTNPSSGTVSARVTLKVNNLPSTGSLDIRVYGIEMVFVPQGAYSLGDGNGADITSYSFAQAATGVGASMSYGVYSEDPQTVFQRDASVTANYVQYPSYGFNTVVPSWGCGLTAAFPKGYKAFYIMKYEISQGEYNAFLNASSAIAQLVHYPSHYTTNFPSYCSSYRHTINRSSPGIFTVDRPYWACNWLAWSDVATFLDWAALRPLTELEFEKACRGTAPAVAWEAAWGANPVSTGTLAVAISGTSPENGTETITTANANVNAESSTHTGGDACQGPLRGGIFAKSTSTSRQQTGASFYGVMELSGNVWEFYISAFAGIGGQPSASGVSEGDGVLSTNGNYNTNNWTPVTTDMWPGPGTSNVIKRGGGWNTSRAVNNGLDVSFRVNSRTENFNRDPYTGGRGGR